MSENLEFGIWNLESGIWSQKVNGWLGHKIMESGIWNLEIFDMESEKEIRAGPAFLCFCFQKVIVAQRSSVWYFFHEII